MRSGVKKIVGDEATPIIVRGYFVDQCGSICKYGIGLHGGIDLRADGVDGLGIGGVPEHGVDHLGDLTHEGFLGPAGGDGGCAETDT